MTVEFIRYKQLMARMTMGIQRCTITTTMTTTTTTKKRRRKRDAFCSWSWK